MIPMHGQTKRGFSPIELLVAVAILCLIATILVIAIGDLRVRSRDERRLSDMKTISSALGLYRSQKDIFPIEPDPIVITGKDSLSAALIEEEIIKSVPTDPSSAENGYVYTYQSFNSGTSFVLRFCLETDSAKLYDKGCSEKNKFTP